MLLQNNLKSFFENNRIPLECNKIIGVKEADVLFLKAMNVGQSFGSFILYTVLNPMRDGLWTNFTSWDDLYENYCMFMVGVMVKPHTANN